MTRDDIRAYLKPTNKDFEDLLFVADRCNKARNAINEIIPRVKDSTMLAAFKKGAGVNSDVISAIAQFFGRVQAQKFMNAVEQGLLEEECPEEEPPIETPDDGTDIPDDSGPDNPDNGGDPDDPGDTGGDSSGGDIDDGSGPDGPDDGGAGVDPNEPGIPDEPDDPGTTPPDPDNDPLPDVNRMFAESRIMQRRR